MWQKFSFYTAELLQTADPGSPLYALQALDITDITSNQESLLFADSEGGITISDDSFSIRRFCAYDYCVNFVHLIPGSNMLISIGDGVDKRDSEERSVARNIAKRFRSTLYGNDTYKWMLEDLHIKPIMDDYVEVSNATLKLWLLDKVDVNGQPLCMKSFKLFDKSEETITAMDVNEGTNTILLGCLTGRVYSILGELSRMKKLSFMPLSNQITSRITSIVINPTLTTSKELVCYVSSLNQIGCYLLPVEGKKAAVFTSLDEEHGCDSKCACLTKGNNLMVAREDGVYLYDRNTCIKSYVLSGEKQYLYCYKNCMVMCMGDKQYELKVLNLENQCEEYEMEVMRNGNNESIRFIFMAWGLLFVMTEGHIVYLLREKSNEIKLEYLYERKLYKIALSIVMDWNMKDSEIAEIHRMYGDSLYDEGKYEEALLQYVKSIPFIDASIIIKRYLDSSYIHQLIFYLEALHRDGTNCSDHTLLLTNCYTKLRDRKKIDEFVYENVLGSQYDVKVVIPVLVASFYYEEALFLSKKHHLDAEYVNIQVSYVKDYPTTIEYIWSLPLQQAKLLLLKYGKVLVDNAVREVMPLFVDSTTGYHQHNHVNQDEGNESIDPEEVLHCFLDRPAILKLFIEEVIRKREKCSAGIWNTLIELSLRRDIDIDQEGNSLQISNEDYDNRILSILEKGEGKYDDEEVMVLLELNHHKEGLVYMYKKMHMYDVLIPYYMENGEYENAILIAKEYGKENKQLWKEMLMLFTSNPDVSITQLQSVMELIEKEESMDIIDMIGIVKENTRVTNVVIKPFVQRLLKKNQSIMIMDKQRIMEAEKSLKEVSSSIDQMLHCFKCFHQTHCVACGMKLEYPSVYFMCGHAYHEACVPENCCIKCESIGSDEKNSITQDVFYSKMSQATDGFAYVADCYSKGLFKEKEEKEVVIDTDIDEDNFVAVETFEL